MARVATGTGELIVTTTEISGSPATHRRSTTGRDTTHVNVMSTLLYIVSCVVKGTPIHKTD